MKRPDMNLAQGRMEDGPLMYYRLMGALEAYLVMGEEEGTSHFRKGGENHTILTRHIKELRTQRMAQKHTNLQGRLRK